MLTTSVNLERVKLLLGIPHEVEGASPPRNAVASCCRPRESSKKVGSISFGLEYI